MWHGRSSIYKRVKNGEDREKGNVGDDREHVAFQPLTILDPYPFGANPTKGQDVLNLRTRVLKSGRART